MRLETERLVLRSMEVEDIEAIIDLWTDPEVTRFLGGPREAGMVRDTSIEDLAQPPAGPFGLWPLIEKSSDRFIGHCGLLDKEIDGAICVELIYVLDRAAWGKGYATEIGLRLLDFAFDELGLDRVVALVEPENLPSRLVAAKVGMRHESTLVRPGGAIRELWSISRPG